MRRRGRFSVGKLNPNHGVGDFQNDDKNITRRGVALHLYAQDNESIVIVAAQFLALVQHPLYLQYDWLFSRRSCHEWDKSQSVSRVKSNRVSSADVKGRRKHRKPNGLQKIRRPPVACSESRVVSAGNAMVQLRDCRRRIMLALHS